jgi:hypothetical protein
MVMLMLITIPKIMVGILINKIMAGRVDTNIIHIHPILGQEEQLIHIINPPVPTKEMEEINRNKELNRKGLMNIKNNMMTNSIEIRDTILQFTKDQIRNRI